MVFPDPRELAILTVNGQDYQEWETVMVKHAMQQKPYYSFRFTCSENQPIASAFRTLQIVPGMKCSVTLAGELAINGLVYTRQVLYDATKHYIEIQGATPVLDMDYGHVVHKTGEFSKKTTEQVIQEIVKPFKINFKVVGGQLPDKQIKRLNIDPASTAMSVVEEILRPMGNVKLTSNPQGDLVAVVGPESQGGTFVEGVNILEGRETIFSVSIYEGIMGMGQSQPNDQDAPAKATQQHEKAEGSSSNNRGTTQIITSEQPPGWDGFLKARGNMDRAWQNEDQVTVYITVQGWLKSGGGSPVPTGGGSGGLWKINELYSVISPMLIMNGSEELRAKTVTFTQDNHSGTRTVLELCNKQAMGPGIPPPGT